MPESPIRKLVPYAEQAIKNGKSIYHLNIGQPDIKTPETALQAIKENDIEILSYSSSEGTESYRNKLASYYKKHNIDVNYKNIIVTTGASEALLFLFSSIMDPGDEVIISEPFYANYFALPPIEIFEKLITPKTRAILICNPGNPTGYVYSKKEIKKLASLVKNNDLFLVADEVYREFIYDGGTHHSIIEENAVLIDSVSKRYSMCGARVGCIVSKNELVLQTVLKFAQARLSPPTYGQIASEAALDTPQSYFDDVISEYAERRDTLITELNKIEGIKIASPKGSFYCILELPVKNSNHFAQWLLEHFDVNGETIMVAPADGFYSTSGMGLNQIRIAYVLKKESLIKAVHILKEALKVYKD